MTQSGSNKCLTVVLLQPSKHQDVEMLFTFHKTDAVGYRPPLAILTLATYIISEGFEDTHCLDAQVEDLSPAETVDRIAKLKPDVVGISTWTDFWYPAWRTIQLTRRRLPDCTIIVGGPHCLVYPEEALRHSDADYVVSGDGEDTLLSLLKSLQAGSPPDDLPGLWRKTGSEIQPPTSRVAVIDDLDKIPNPDRTLLPYERYNSVLNHRAYEATMITSRGCPFRCVFCKMHAQKVYARSAENVVEEFRDIAAMGITDIQVYDDTFTWSKKRVIDICNGILDHGLEIRWAIRDRVARADPELYAILKKAGCYRIHFGVESGSPPILKASGKGITLEEVEYALRLAHQTGFDTMAFYLFGFLDETYEDAMKTIRFAIRCAADYVTFSVLIPYPGTAIYKEALERGIIPHDFWLEFTRNPVPDFRIPHLIEQHLDRHALVELKNRALRRFYFRPSRLLREIMISASWREFYQKARMGASIITDSLKNMNCPGMRRPRTQSS